MKVGTIVELLRPMLGNKAGVKGVVYENYNIGHGPGISVIFVNGEYDGFSVDERKFLKKVGFNKKLSYYIFTNVMKLSNDFRDGFFNDAF